MKALLFIFVFAAVACSHKPKTVDNVSLGEPKPTTAASIEAKQVAAEEEAQAVTEIQFKKGASTLTAESKNKIRKLLEMIKDHKVDAIKVITWSDKEYPAEDQTELSQGQQILVRQRNTRIKNFISQQRKGDFEIEMVSMAERSGKLKELWGDADARLKKSLEAAGIPNSDDPQKGQPKASRSIVMLILKSKDQ